ncbi:MAPEG family protein [Phenylobacterium sp. LjRoot225]|uniref:MAPEG family protein n=1 Tax=Phenylobacterium sp. LjRoot225 TaxID=3342285 RepID=UPI003ED0A2C8
MQPHIWVALASLAAVLTVLGMGINVGRVRHACKIPAPAMTGDPRLERAIRIHYNSLEWLTALLVSMWLFAIYWNDAAAAGLGAVWVVGRIIYAQGYMRDPLKRAPGFIIQALATLVLLFGAAGRLIWMLVAGVGA